MYKFICLICLPYILLAGSGKLVYVVDGDTVVLETTKGNVTCHMGEIDTPETKVNSKLKKEMRKCAFSQEEFLKVGKLAHNKAKSLLKVGTTYNYKVLGYTRNKNPICKLTLPKGLHVEIRPSFDEMMVSRGYALPYVINSTQHQSKLLLKIAKEAKHKKLGLWNEHYDLMQCLVEHRYSLRSLR